MEVPFRQIRADHTDDSITVYQAYQPDIADEALTLGSFGPSFGRGRMTWIKPSFRWMMYRSGWSTKPGQERILAIRISRSGFEWALRHSGLSHYDPAIHPNHQAWLDTKRAPVRIQWDPERDVRLRPLGYRSLQAGLSGEAVVRYIDEWITGISDVTDLARTISGLVANGRLGEADDLIPVEKPYPVPADIASLIGA